MRFVARFTFPKKLNACLQAFTTLEQTEEPDLVRPPSSLKYPIYEEQIKHIEWVLKLSKVFKQDPIVAVYYFFSLSY